MRTLYKILLILLIIVVVFIILRLLNIKQFLLEKIYPRTYQEYVEKYAKEYDIDPLLIFSIIKAESNFNPNAESTSGAKGLMQLMDDTAIELANNINDPIEAENLFEPEKNIMLGTKYYADLLKIYDNNMLLALTAYNAGIGNVNTWIETGIIEKDGSDIENIPYKETNMYVRKILRNYRMYLKIYKTKE